MNVFSLLFSHIFPENDDEESVVEPFDGPLVYDASSSDVMEVDENGNEPQQEILSMTSMDLIL